MTAIRPAIRPAIGPAVRGAFDGYQPAIPAAALRDENNIPLRDENGHLILEG